MKRASIGAVVVVAGLLSSWVGWGCKGDKPSAAAPQPSSAPAPASTPGNQVAAEDTTGPDAFDAPALNRLEMPSGVVIEDLKIGHGEAALPRAVLTFHYRGKIKDGAEFDNTTKRPAGPTPEVQSIDRLISGLSSGLVGIKAGGRRRITVPPQLAPGVVGVKDAEGNFRIPPDATLIYVVDAVAIKQQLTTTPAVQPAK